MFQWSIKVWIPNWFQFFFAWKEKCVFRLSFWIGAIFWHWIYIEYNILYSILILSTKKPGTAWQFFLAAWQLNCHIWVNWFWSNFVYEMLKKHKIFINFQYWNKFINPWKIPSTSLHTFKILKPFKVNIKLWVPGFNLKKNNAIEAVKYCTLSQYLNRHRFRSWLMYVQNILGSRFWYTICSN